MSAQDFQAKFATVMESVLQSAIAETTKLFEAMVDELKADMSRIKKDNDDLKAKCSQFECAQKGSAVGNKSSEKRHRAVQCDIMSFCNKVAEQSQPSVPERCSLQETFYPFQEHNYDVRASGRTVDRHEKSGDFLYSESGSPGASQSETGSDGASTKTRELPQELPDLGMYNNLQGGQNQEGTGRPENGPATSAGGHGPPPNSALMVNTSQAPSVQPRKRYTSVTLQDARLLVEAMSSSVDRAEFSPQQLAAEPEPVPSGGALRTHADLQILPRSSEILEELAAAEPSQEGVNVAQPRETEAQVSAAPAAVEPRAAPALQTSAPSKDNKRVPQKITVTPRHRHSSLESNQCPALAPAAAMKVDTAGKTAHEQTTTAPDSAPGALTATTVPVNTPFNSASMSLPVTEPTIFRELPSGTQQRPTIKIVFPSHRTVEPVPESDRSGERAERLPSQELKPSVEPPTPADVPSTASQAQKQCSESGASLKSLAGLKLPAGCHIKPFAMVTLTRLPFLMSTEESVKVSRLTLSHPVLNQDTSSPRPSSKSPPLTNDSGAPPLTAPPLTAPANVTQTEVPWEPGRPVEQKTSSKDPNKDSRCCADTGSSKHRRSKKDGWKGQPRSRLKPHLEEGSTSYQHAETQTVSARKEQQDSKLKLDLAEVAGAVSSSRADGGASIQTRKSGLCRDVTEPAAPSDNDPDDETSSTGPSSAVRNATARSTKPGCRHPDANATPRSPRRTGTSPDTAQPKRAKSASSLTSSKPKTHAAASASVLHGTCTSVPLGPSRENGRKRSNSSDGRTDGRDSKSTVVKKPRRKPAETTPKAHSGVVNAKKLAKKAKANLRKRKVSRKLSQKRAKTTRLEATAPSSVAARKIRSSGVWIPPVGDATSNEPEHASLKTETTSPKAADRGAVDPPRVSLHPIPVKAPPMVSPLQPLSLIGTRLLKNQCGMCGQVLGSSSALESHVSLHTRRPFSCRLCGKNFTDTKALKRHGRVHRNGKIHVCHKCGKAFVYKFSLSKHLQMVHRRIKPFVCQICNKSFFTKLDVESHIRIHTGEKPFHCNLCERRFIRRVDLNVHLRWHNGEKRHWCPYCKKGFLDFNNLKRHKYIHTGEKPHPCTHCPKQFTQSAHLKKHLKNVHKVA